MPVRQRMGWSVLHMLPHWLFITAARYEKRLHPSPSSNEFLHGDSIQGAGVYNGLSLKKDREWAAIIPYYMTELQRDTGQEKQVCGVDGNISSFACACSIKATRCLRILFYCDNTADSQPGVSHTRALMSCAPACAWGDYHLQQHWSQQDTNRKGEERWPTAATATKALAEKQGHAAKFKVFFKMESPAMEVPRQHNDNAKVNTSTGMGVIHSCTPSGSLGCCV